MKGKVRLQGRQYISSGSIWVKLWGIRAKLQSKSYSLVCGRRLRTLLSKQILIHDFARKIIDLVLGLLLEMT
ncbi:hypothetical protein Gogos_015200 [Gossypium gossypioides]|uniref:Uncharacterized protein n=1 Tax=Gossypium gossypioides TaxID=34282 RepID=A0A7J9C0U5_GOSGO|nr:hypothetical protein [Gossypium gossypioides]